MGREEKQIFSCFLEVKVRINLFLRRSYSFYTTLEKWWRQTTPHELNSSKQAYGCLNPTKSAMSGTQHFSFSYEVKISDQTLFSSSIFSHKTVFAFVLKSLVAPS